MRQINRAIAILVIAAVLGQLTTACNSSSEKPTSGREAYNPIDENPFLRVSNNPLSTFYIDVDAAYYSNVRRFINLGQLPPKDAVRLEELINYFTYEYPQPKGDRPFSVTTKISDTPWNPSQKLVHIGLQGKNISTENLPPSNLVFLFDVSGSMDEPNKLPLLKSAFRLLVNELRDKDRVYIVVYAESANRYPDATTALNALRPLDVISCATTPVRRISAENLRAIATQVLLINIALISVVSTGLMIPRDQIYPLLIENPGAAVRQLQSTNQCLRCNLRGADLRNSNLIGVNLTKANLTDADLRNADLRSAYLESVDLTNADLRGADLRGTYLQGANLTSADIQDTNLKSADLRGAIMPNGFINP